VKYVTLKKHAPFMKKRAEVGLAALARCKGSDCAKQFLEYADGDPDNKDFAMDAGRLVAKSSPADAMPYFRRALSGRKAPKECGDAAVGSAVVRALDLAPEDPRVADAVEIADKVCWDATKDKVVDGFINGGTRYKVNSCGFLTAHNALSPLSAKQCQSAIQKGKNTP
jgi:hypothetical protein